MSRFSASVVVVCGTCLVLAPQVVHAVLEANTLFANGIAARSDGAGATFGAAPLPAWMVLSSVVAGLVMITLGVVAMLFGARSRSA